MNKLSPSIRDSLPPHNDDQSLLLLGNAGKDLWAHLEAINYPEPHRFNRFSIECAQQVLNEYIGSQGYEILYPSSSSRIALQQLGHYAGWGQPSLLGLDIHPQYGTWFAYRLVALTSLNVQYNVAGKTTNNALSPVCLDCKDKPCVSACPVSAVAIKGSLKLNNCLQHRLKEDSSCAPQCFSRRACPVGLGYAYNPKQYQYHSLSSLADIKAYYRQ